MCRLIQVENMHFDEFVKKKKGQRPVSSATPHYVGTANSWMEQVDANAC